MHKLEEPQTCQATGENTQAEDEKSRRPSGPELLRIRLLLPESCGAKYDDRIS